jgi:6-phosphogluconolactonase
VTVTDSGRFVLSAHYGEGRVETFSVAEDGRLGASVGTRATGEQAHSIVLDPSNRFVFVPNKGSNRITQLIFDHSTGQLQPNSPEQLSANGGPRHLAFHPTRPLAYAMNEVVPGMTAYVFDAERGTLAELNQKSAVPAGFSGESSGGDVHVAPSGRFVYGSLRAGDASSIVIYSIDEATGRVSLVGHESTRGRTPRNFTIHPDGSLLLAANQDSNSISTFRVDQQTGLLEFIETTDVGVAPFFVRIVRF